MRRSFLLLWSYHVLLWHLSLTREQKNLPTDRCCQGKRKTKPFARFRVVLLIAHTCQAASQFPSFSFFAMDAPLLYFEYTMRTRFLSRPLIS